MRCFAATWIGFDVGPFVFGSAPVLVLGLYSPDEAPDYSISPHSYLAGRFCSPVRLVLVHLD